jgi:hypothetical protein
MVEYSSMVIYYECKMYKVVEEESVVCMWLIREAFSGE